MATMKRQPPTPAPVLQVRTGYASIREAAKYLGVSVNTIRAMKELGQLKTKLVGQTDKITWTSIYAAEGREIAMAPVG